MKLKKMCFGFISLLLVMNISSCGVNNKKEKLINYLNDKYDEEFVIEDFRGGIPTLTEQYGGTQAIVYPKGNKELVFNAGFGENEENTPYDNYNLVKLNTQFSDSFKSTLDRIVSTNYDYKIVVYVPQNVNDDVKDMTIEEYFEYIGESITLDLEIALEVDNEEDRYNYYEELYSLYNELMSYGVERSILSVAFVDNVNDSKVKEHLDKVQITDNFWHESKVDMYGELFTNTKRFIESSDALEEYYTPNEK